MNISEHAEFKTHLFEHFARISKALASPRRLELVDVLSQGERTVEELAHLTGMSVANTSRHLQAMRAARLLGVRRSGLFAHYRLADENVFRVWQGIRDLGETRLADVRLLVSGRFAGRTAPGPIGLEEMRERFRSGEGVLLDARPEREFQAGHIPGALSIPIEELESRLHVLSPDEEVIAYCRGPYCAFSDEAVTMLRANGYRARRFALGFADWRAAGLPVDSPHAGS